MLGNVNKALMFDKQGIVKVKLSTVFLASTVCGNTNSSRVVKDSANGKLYFSFAFSYIMTCVKNDVDVITTAQMVQIYGLKTIYCRENSLILFFIFCLTCALSFCNSNPIRYL